ncbi:MAG: indole-3-glycerol-phosphate synthase [Thermoanaerobaculia bacterium]|nr:indole-3-glycerol-phosphate synthase [Thermoanaerobaculia bacterium]
MTSKPPEELPDILRRIVERRRARVAEEHAASVLQEVPMPPEEDRSKILEPHQNSFLGSLARRRGRGIIAEVKLGSPRIGSLEDRIDPETQAETYAENGAAALSVVVEPDFFHGSYDLLRRCREASGLPAIAKDFVVDEIQLEWARSAGADAVLLIASLFTRESLAEMAQSARSRALVPLVEIHDLSELEKLEGGRWELVGVNNRDLRSFEVELENSMALASTLPTEALKISESGIQGADEIRLLAGMGFDAFLIGESLLLASDPGTKLRELLGA